MGDRYGKVESGTRASNDVRLLTNWTVDDIESWFMVHAAAANASKIVDPEADLFVQGFDR